MLHLTKRIKNTNAIIKNIDKLNQNTLFESSVFKTEPQELYRILSGEIYGRPYARYILLKTDLIYHGHTSKFAPPRTISIEHVLPQSPNMSNQWASDFTEKDGKDWTNKLGNLVLISRRKSSALSNRVYSEKRDKYFKHNVELFSNSIRIFQKFHTWNLDDLKRNHKETLNKLKEHYEG